MPKLIKAILRNFQVKVSIAFILAMLFSGTLSNYLIYKFALKSQFEQLRDKLKVIAQTAALSINPDTLSKIPLRREGIDTVQYNIVVDQLKKIRQVNTPILSVYIFAKTDKQGILQFVADADIPNEEEIREGMTFYPGDTYNAVRFPEMLKAFDGPSVDKKICKDEWGYFLSGYSPIRDAGGKTVAILGVDIAANQVYLIQGSVHRRALLVLVLGILFSSLLGLLISRSITGPIEELVEGTHNIAKGNLRYHVAVKGDDQISELIQSFNEMADSLYDSREKLHEYFYNVLQSFVRIMEASDEYTQGHSKRVSEYAGKIAVKIGLSEQKIELLKEAALLHDIGKLGVEKDILNKKEPLTEAEWEKIKKHPLIGEDIVRSVVLNKEMLSVVRHHHERYDGKGYPDRLSGKDIGIFAAIISVADAYDAMVSSRAYRKALSTQKVIDELKNNRNTQFNKAVVDILIEIIEEERR